LDNIYQIQTKVLRTHFAKIFETKQGRHWSFLFVVLSIFSVEFDFNLIFYFSKSGQ